MVSGRIEANTMVCHYDLFRNRVGNPSEHRNNTKFGRSSAAQIVKGWHAQMLASRTRTGTGSEHAARSNHPFPGANFD
jgi:hypothetical protein